MFDSFISREIFILNCLTHESSSVMGLMVFGWINRIAYKL